MTESVFLPRSRSRSNRSSARSRLRSAAAAGNSAARTTARQDNAPAGDALHDEPTLDLFGDPVLEPAVRASAAARVEAVAEVDVAAGGTDGGDVGRQATLDGFGASGDAAGGEAGGASGAAEPAAAGATMNESAATSGNGDALGGDVVRSVDTAAHATEGADAVRMVDAVADATKGGDAVRSVDTAADATKGSDVARSVDTAADATKGGDAVRSVDAAADATKGGDVLRSVDAAADAKGSDVARQPEDVVTIAANESAADNGHASPRSAAGGLDAGATKTGHSMANDAATGGAADHRSAKAGNDGEGIDVTASSTEAARTTGATTKGRRASSSSGKRRAAAGAGATAAVTTVPESTGSTAVPDAAPTTGQQATPEPVEPASTHDADRPAAASASAEVQPVASVASFVTKPSADRAQPPVPNAPAFDPDTHLRPLSEKLAALQGEMAGVKRAADREMRRVNRLLLALAFVVFAALVTLVLQTRQVASLKQELDARQQRVDRLAADLSTQQATLMTLTEHYEVLLSQVDRLQRSANREAAAAKRARRTR